MRKRLFFLAALLIASLNLASTAWADEVVTLPDGVTAKDYTMSYFDEEDASKQVDVSVAFDGNDVYVRLPRFSADIPAAWVKGTLSGSEISFAIPQYMGLSDWGEDCYFHACSGLTDLEELVFDYNDTNKSFTTENSIYFAPYDDATPFSASMKLNQPTFSPKDSADDDEEAGDKVVTLPEGVSTKDYTMSYYRGLSKQRITETTVKVAFVGNDVYVAGAFVEMPDAYIKGTLSGETITFPAGQFLGTDDYGDSYYFQPYTRDEAAKENTDADAMICSYDAATKAFTADGYMSFSTTKGSINNSNPRYGYPTFPPNADYEPAAPLVEYAPNFNHTVAGYFITLPAPEKDVNGVKINQANLTYRIYYDVNRTSKVYVATKEAYGFDADKSEFPYGYVYDNEPYPYISEGMFYLVATDDTNPEDWNRVGLQWVYNYEGNAYESEIVWKAIKDYEPIIPATPTAAWNVRNGVISIRLSFPMKDTKGNTLDPEKMSYKIYYDENHTTGVYTAYTDEYVGLTDDMDEFPYGLDDDNDIFPGMFYLYDNKDTKPEDWNRVGLQTIYTIDGEVTQSEIGWTDIKDYTADITAKSADATTYYATFYNAAYSYKAPEGVSVYTAKVSADGTYLNLTAVSDNIIPAGNAVILEATNASFSLNETEAEGTLADNDLKGVSEETAVESGKTYYVLSAQESVVGFYHFTGTTLAAGKAFVAIEGDATAKALPFGDSTTGLTTLSTQSEKSGEVYNLAGQRVSSDYKGIVVINGKKVIR